MRKTVEGDAVNAVAGERDAAADRTDCHVDMR